MKKINSGVYFVIIVAFVCLFFQTGHAATYYVKNSGNDNASGLDDSSAWRTITKVNGFNFSGGDVVLFKRGDTFSDKGLRISNVNDFTIADYGEGEKPLFDGNKIKPIYIGYSKNITIRNINISGQEWHIDKSSNIGLSNVENIIIDGVYGDGHTFEGTPTTNGKNAIGLVNCSGIIEIKNCELFNWGPYDMLESSLLSDYLGLALMDIDDNAEYKIHDNVIYNIYSDCIHVYITKATGKIYNNILYNGGEDSIDVKGAENCEIYNNEFYRTPDFLGEGGTGSGGVPTYIVVHDAVIDGVEYYAKNITIRNNSFKDGDAAGIKLGKVENTTIYENTFSNVKSALYIENFVTNTKFHHNIIENPQSRESPNRMFDAGCIYENNVGEGTQIFNNTIYNKNGSAKHLVMLGSTNGTAVYNNIVYQGNASEDAFGLYRNVGTEPIIRDNYWYNPNKINRTKYSNKIYTANMQEEWNEKFPGDKFDNPLMNDPEEGDYSLYEKSLKIGAVYDDQAEESVADPLIPDTEEGQDVIINNRDPEASWVGDWQVSGAPDPYGEDSVWSRWGANKFTWHFTPLQTSDFELLMWWTEWPSRSNSVPVDIEHAGGTSQVIIDQSTNGGKWNSLGKFFFESGQSYRVTITAQPGPSSTCADAVRFVTVQGPPTAAFTADPVSGTAPLTVHFTDTSTGSVDSWSWDFNNDGIVDSTEQNPSYTYNTIGMYTVKLTVSGPGGSHTQTSTDFINVSEPGGQPPVAEFAANPVSGVAPLTVNFTDQSSGDITEWSWDFNNDGTVDSTEQNPSYTFDEAGIYTVKLTVSGFDGTDDGVKSGFITVTWAEGDSSLIDEENLETADEITLSVVSYKVRGVGVSELTWSGAASVNVNIYRDGRNIKTTENDGEYTDKSFGKGSGSTTYQVCEAGTSVCSNSVFISW